MKNSTISVHYLTVVKLNASFMTTSKVSSLIWETNGICTSGTDCSVYAATNARRDSFSTAVFMANGTAYSGPYSRDNYRFQRPALHNYNSIS